MNILGKFVHQVGFIYEITQDELPIARPPNSYDNARIRKNEINVAYSTYGRSEECVKNFTRKT